MPGTFAGLSEDELVCWIEDSLATGSHRLGAGYQAHTLLYQGVRGNKLVVKCPAGRGLRRWLSILMLRHEARVYERLGDFPAAPRYFGLLRGRYLLLEFIAGQSARSTDFADRSVFFNELHRSIEALHARGIAHSDLQKQDNLLVVEGRRPCLLDFGAAVLRKNGFAPFNHLHFRFARRLDINQYIKLKYRKNFQNLSPEDRLLFRRTLLERLARSLKRTWRLLRHGSPDRPPPRPKL